MTERRFEARALHGWMCRVLVHCGVSSEDADLTAYVLLRTSLRGIDTHGIARLPSYAEKLLAGDVNPRAVPRHSWRHGALLVEGDCGLGQVVASAAVRLAVDKTKDAAAVSCVIENRGHLSALGSFVVQAAEQGRVALLCQRTPPIMAQPGASGPAMGNNPIAFAAPVANDVPLVFDMAGSVVARGAVMQAQRDKRSDQFANAVCAA